MRRSAVRRSAGLPGPAEQDRRARPGGAPGGSVVAHSVRGRGQGRGGGSREICEAPGDSSSLVRNRGGRALCRLGPGRAGGAVAAESRGRWESNWGGTKDPGGPLARALEGFHEAVRALEGQVEARRRYDEDYLRRGVSMLAVEGSTPQILRSVPFLSSLETLGVKVSPKNIYIAPPELPRQN